MASALENIFITGYAKGMVQNKRPFLIPDQAWQVMDNAYTWRERILKREGLEFLGRLRRSLMAQVLGLTSGGTTDSFVDILAGFRANEPNAELQQSGLFINVDAGFATFTDNGDGTFTVGGNGLAAGSFVNYITGQVVLNYSVAPPAGQPIVANFGYYPSLPAMGISTQDQAPINQENTLFWDQRYAYIFVGTLFQEYLPAAAVTWASSNSDFFFAYNYRQLTSANRILFETNFVPTNTNPMRFTDGATWTTFIPQVNPTTFVQTAKIIISYFSRLILLNTWEGDNANPYVSSTNFFARCRFSAQGDPTAVNAFREDIFGKGGFLDAPTAESIIGAEFVQNTLIVSFEHSKWQLRFVGEYGPPFIWERVSLDYGSESLFSTVQLDNLVLDMGDKALVATNAVNTKRMDLELPDQVFLVQNQNNGPDRVWGVREFFKELIYWCYPDITYTTPAAPLIFPNKVLLYNYRNNTWAIFRDNVTCFGYFQNFSGSSKNVLWDSLTVFWDDQDVFWDDVESGNPGFQFVVAGNQQGYIHLYASKTPDDPSLSISAVTFTPVTIFPITININNHNYIDKEIIYLTDLHFISTVNFLPVTTSLNNAFFIVTVISANVIQLSQWNFTTQSPQSVFPISFMQGITPIPVTQLMYVGCGESTLFPKLNIFSKDINIYQNKGLGIKLSHLDFLMQPHTNSAMTINIWLNAANNSVSGNMATGQTGINLNLDPAFYSQASEYSWFRFYASASGQYFNINITYDDNLMNTLSTHQTQLTLYAINAGVKRGGKIIF